MAWSADVGPGAPGDRATGRHAAGGGGPLATRLDAHLRRSGLLERGMHLLIALSGGLDSVVLLHLLRFPLRDWRFRLTAAHFDHRMRPGSAGDAAWVRGLCGAWGVPLEQAEAAAGPRSEAEARSVRYTFLRESARAVAADRILTAHQRDDQAETVLFRLARGTGVRGLAGIPARRGPLVRPLLPFSRADLDGYARRAGLRWREDPTNQDLTFARNRIRRDLLPLLESVAPGARARIAALARSAAAAEDAWSSVEEGLLSDLILEAETGAVLLARDRFLDYHPNVQARLLRRLLRRLGSSPDRAGTRAALQFIRSGASGGRFHVAGNVRIEREFDGLRIGPAAPPRATRSLSIAGPGTGHGVACVGGRRYAIEWRPGPGSKDDAESFVVSALSFPLRVRDWQPGDRIRMSYGSKKLKKLFGEKRIGRRARGELPVLVDADRKDAVLWIPGVARADRARPGTEDGAEETLTIGIRHGEHG